MIHNRSIIHVAVLVLLLVLPFCSGQPSNGGTTPTPQQPILSDRNFKPSMLVVIIVLIAAFFFMGFFSIYLRQCVGEGQTGIGGSIRSAANIGRRSRRVLKGLDQTVIDTFPTFLYSEVKGLKIGKGTLECAVCLNEFEDDETLRLLPKCDHVFHPECIDAWLGSHTTCPVCRSNLNDTNNEVSAADDADSVPTVGSESATGAETYTEAGVDTSVSRQPEIDECQERVLINVNDSEQEGTDQVKIAVHQEAVIDRMHISRQNRSKSTRKPWSKVSGKFPRSHSTGHSLVQPGENVDRFTLRLPVEVRKQIVESELNRSASYANAQTRMKGGSGGGSGKPGVNRSGKYFQFGRLDRAAKSDHWGFKLTVPFFTRNASVRNNGKVDGSAVILPLDSVGAKVDGTSTSVAARPPV